TNSIEPPDLRPNLRTVGNHGVRGLPPRGLSHNVARDAEAIPPDEVLKPSQSNLYAHDSAIVCMHDGPWCDFLDFPVLKTGHPMCVNDIEVACDPQHPVMNRQMREYLTFRGDPRRLHQLYLIASFRLRFGDTADPILQATQTCCFSDMKDFHSLYLEETRGR